MAWVPFVGKRVGPPCSRDLDRPFPGWDATFTTKELDDLDRSGWLHQEGVGSYPAPSTRFVKIRFLGVCS